MNYNVYTIAYFDKQLKRLVKKYPSLKLELVELIATISATPETGTDLGNNCFKNQIGNCI